MGEDVPRAKVESGNNRHSLVKPAAKYKEEDVGVFRLVPGGGVEPP
jgi:hypothetical protein